LDLHLELDFNGGKEYDDNHDTLEWSVIIREEDRLGLFENMVLRKGF
jgi:hypothetical protein